MRKLTLALLAGFLTSAAALAGPFNEGIGSAMIYGPYTGGHNYSYNTAYSYGFAFSSADTWRRDLFAYPAGVYPYRPNGQPIYYRVCPRKDVPPISVPGEDGLPVLVHPGLGDGAIGDVSTAVPGGVVALQPVPTQTAAPALAPVAPAVPATIKVLAPPGAEVWLEKQKLPGDGAERAATTPPLAANKTYVYTVRATWTENGRAVDQFRVVGVRAGETAKVNFLVQR
jgi:uncharacterized protein (TIGR03000 family)